MIRLISLSTIFVFSLFIYSCSMITGSSQEPDFQFEKETFVVHGEIKDTYRSLDVISIRVKTDIDIEEFNDDIKATDLQLLTPFSHSRYSAVTTRQVQSPLPIVLLLPHNVNRSHFYSFSDNLNDDSFANNPFIVYSLPAYTRDPKKLSWYYPNNKISLKPSTEDFSASEFLEQFNLEFLSKNPQIDLYTFSDNYFSHGSPYELAQSIFDSGVYKYVVPDAFHKIVRH